MKRHAFWVAIVLIVATVVPAFAEPILISGAAKHPGRLVDFENPGWVRLDQGLSHPLVLTSHFGLGVLRTLGIVPEAGQ